MSYLLSYQRPFYVIDVGLIFLLDSVFPFFYTLHIKKELLSTIPSSAPRKKKRVSFQQLARFHFLRVRKKKCDGNFESVSIGSDLL
jgi:hypothetical protein